MAQGLRAQTTAVLSLVPSTHIVWLTTASNSRFRGQGSTPHACKCTNIHVHRHIHTHIIKIIKINIFKMYNWKFS